MVPNNFPIPVEGIIGKDFIKKFHCLLDYLTLNFGIRYNNEFIKIPINNDSRTQEWHRIPPRCEVIRTFRLSTKSLADQVVDQIEIHPGVFIARAIVNPQDCNLRILNTTDRYFEINPILTLQTTSLDKFHQITITPSETNRQIKLNKILSKNIPHHTPSSLISLCHEFSSIFALPGDKHSVNNFYKQSLQLNDHSPVYVKNYRSPHTQKDEINRQINDMLEKKIIEPSLSSYNSPILLVPKKSLNGDKKYRLCIDYRQLNKKLIPDKFPLPRIEEILDSLGRTQYFSKLDLHSGFHQISLDNNSKHMTSFSTPQGSFQFNVLPFGLNVAPNSFARMMSIAFSGIDPSSAFIYLDDIIVIGISLDHHINNLRKVFQTCKDRNLKLNPDKCEFLKSEIIFLGHKCTKNGILPDDSKFDTIKNYPIPKDGESIKRFIAFCNYYRKFIPNFGVIAKPLNNLTKKNAEFKWTEEHTHIFNSLKQTLMNPPILQYPDFNKQFILTVDASKQGIGAVLSQLSDDGNDLPIAFASSGFSTADQNKPPIYQELLAIYFGIKHFRPYLYGTHFLVRSDHKPLSFLFTMKDPATKFARIRTELTAYNFTIEHIKGADNVAADALSRIEFDSIKNIKGNKQLLVTTRSATNKNNEMNQCANIVEAMNNIHIKKYPSIKFNIDKDECNFSIRGRHLWKSKTFIIRPGSVTQSLRLVLTELKNISLTKRFKNLRINNKDGIFKLINRQEFISLAKEVLKELNIYIMSPTKEIKSEKERADLIQHFHDHEIEGGHVGQKRLYQKLRSQFTWKNMAKDVATFVKNCPTCRINKPKIKNKESLQLTETPPHPFHTIAIDTIGPFPTTTNRNKYAVTIICEFSKYLIIKPIPNKESKTIANVLLNSCILTYGPIRIIKSDLGTEYVNSLMTDLSNLLHISHNKSTAYHHETIGSVERSHKTLNEYLRNYIHTNKDWPTLIKYFEYCYNSTPNSSIDMYTPFELVFGRKAGTLIHHNNDNKNKVSVNEYINNVKRNLELAYDNTTEFINKNKLRTKAYYDRSINPIEIKIGDNVLLINEVRSKLDPLYKDNYIVRSVEDKNVLIENTLTGKSVLVHKNRIRKT